jgi:hypothetical protein
VAGSFDAKSACEVGDYEGYCPLGSSFLNHEEGGSRFLRKVVTIYPTTRFHIPYSSIFKAKNLRII